MKALAPLLDAAALRAAGRQPPLPFRIALADGSMLGISRLLRVLPGKRIVGEADYKGMKMLAKIFIARGSARHWRREQAGVEALLAAGLPTPALLSSQALQQGGHVLLSRFISDARSVDEDWQALAATAPGSAAAIALLAPAFALLGRLHASGLVQEDLHLGNFLHSTAENSASELLLIDGDGIRRRRRGALALPAAADNVALLIAQLPPAWDEHEGEALRPLLQAWQDADPALPTLTMDVLQSRIARRRAARLADYLDKSGRQCTLFQTARHGRRHSISVRSQAEALAPLLADPDAALAAGKLLKEGNTCTVASVQLGELDVVIKRYNIKNFRHALSRAWRPSRAAHAWRAGHLLSFVDIATPAPLAVIEERCGPLRQRAWLITAWSAGSELSSVLAPWVGSAPPPAIASALRQLFASLQRQRISHGDLKANNLLWQDGKLQLIDLDSLRQHRCARSHARAWRRDRARLLRNWPASSALYQWLDAELPPA